MPRRNTSSTTFEEPNTDFPEPAFDVSRVTKAMMPVTSKTGLPNKRMKLTCKITKRLQTRSVQICSSSWGHRTDLQHFTEKRIADHRRAITKKNPSRSSFGNANNRTIIHQTIITLLGWK